MLIPIIGGIVMLAELAVIVFLVVYGYKERQKLLDRIQAKSFPEFKAFEAKEDGEDKKDPPEPPVYL